MENKMSELDDNINMLLEEIRKAEEKEYDDMVLVEVLMLYQQATNLLWQKVNILMNKNG